MIVIGEDIEFTGEIAVTDDCRTAVETRWVRDQWGPLQQSLYFWADSEIDWAVVKAKGTNNALHKLYVRHGVVRNFAGRKSGFIIPVFLGTSGRFRWVFGDPPNLRVGDEVRLT